MTVDMYDPWGNPLFPTAEILLRDCANQCSEPIYVGRCMKEYMYKLTPEGVEHLAKYAYTAQSRFAVFHHTSTEAWLQPEHGDLMPKIVPLQYVIPNPTDIESINRIKEKIDCPCTKCNR